MNLNPLQWSPTKRILAGLVAGFVLGAAARGIWGPSPELLAVVAQFTQPVGNIFLRIIFMVVVPLVMASIVLGVAELGDVRQLGRMGLRCFAITVLLTATSVAIGVLLVNVLQPGRVLSPEKKAELIQQYGGTGHAAVVAEHESKPPLQALVELIPLNPLNEAANAFAPGYTGGGLLSVMIFSVFVGVSIALRPKAKTMVLLGFFEGLFDVAMTIIGFAMRLAPVCVLCLGFSITVKLGFAIIQTLGVYILVVLLALALQMFGTNSVVLLVLGRKSPRVFFPQIREAMATAFSTSSSNATLPTTLRVAEEELGLPPQISRFVLTLGAAANHNGTALYEGVTVLFLAQVFGVDLSVARQLEVAGICILAGMGAAGVPGGSLPLIAGILGTIGVPPEAIALIIGVDRYLDMCRTTLNVTGDLVSAVVVAQGQTDAAHGPEATAA